MVTDLLAHASCSNMGGWQGSSSPLGGVCNGQVRKRHVQRQAVPHLSLNVRNVHQEARGHAHQGLRFCASHAGPEQACGRQREEQGRTSDGQVWNQSKEVQLTSAGNWRARMRKRSPTGLKHSTTCRYLRT